MNKPRQKYNVYLIGTGHGCYAKDYQKIFLGTTFAASEAQACNNVRYRMRDDKNPNGGYSIWSLDDRADEGYVLYSYKAELA